MFSPVELWGIKVPAARISSVLVRGRGLKPMGIAAELPAMKLITQYLNSYSTVAGSLRSERARGVRHSPSRSSDADRRRRSLNSLELIKGRGLKAARTEAVLKTIERGHETTDISAERLGVTLRRRRAPSSPSARRREGRAMYLSVSANASISNTCCAPARRDFGGRRRYRLPRR